MSSDNKTKSNLIFLFVNPENFRIDCNKESFEKLLQNVIDSNYFTNYAYHLGSSILIQDNNLYCELRIVVGSKLLYHFMRNKTIKNDSYRHELFTLEPNYITEMFQCGFEKSLFGDLNRRLNEIFDLSLEKIEKMKNSTAKNSPLTENQISVNTIEPKPKFDLRKVCVKKTKDPVVLDNIEFAIFDEHRRIVSKFGRGRLRSESILRSVNLNDKISALILRKNNGKSILRQDRTDKNKFVLKIGTGVFHGTADDKKFEWRAPHTAENVKHIEDALINFNKWFEEKLKEEKEEEEKQKIETERKKKEEEKCVELLQKYNFIELK